MYSYGSHMAAKLKQFNTPQGVFLVDIERDTKFVHAFTHSGYEISEMESAIPKELGVAVDVGAHIGTWSVALSRVAKEVHSFEPLPASAELLRKNIALNNLSNVVVHERAVSKHPETLSISYEKASNRAGTVLGKGGTIDAVALDSVFPKEKIDFLKIDVEGMEYNVILGAKKLIKRCRPIIHIEINKRLPRWKAFYIWFYLSLLGYKFNDHFIHRSTFNVLATPGRSS